MAIAAPDNFSIIRVLAGLNKINVASIVRQRDSSSSLTEMDHPHRPLEYFSEGPSEIV